MKARRSLALFLVFALGTLLGSCSSLLGVDDYKSSSDDLCELLVACYDFPACNQHVGGSLDAASATDRTAWLVAFSDEGCLLKCTSARKCLNIEPVCEDGGEGCSIPEQCCGFLTGQASCDQVNCCRPQGVPCKIAEGGPEQGDCCTGLTCSRETGTCGGTICRGVNQFCQNDFDCCTKACRDFKCAENLCAKAGEACEEPATPCCDGQCGPNKRCGCANENEACELDSDCCNGPGSPISLQCVADENGKFCRQDTCTPDEQPCQLDGDCCSLHCDTQQFLCGQPCQAVGADCQSDETCCTGQCGADGKCACSTEFCTQSSDCCEVTPGLNDGKCYGGVCHPACLPQSCDHGVCGTGGPLDPNDPSCSPATATDCVKKVCAGDPFCCCNGWDQYCAEDAVALCGPTACD